MTQGSRVLVCLIVLFWSGITFAQTDPTEIQKLRSQADAIEDKAAQAIDDGNMDQGLGFMEQAIKLDATPLRYMNYGSILFGNGVAVFKDSDKEKGFNPKQDQTYLSQCYFLLGEMYLNAFGDRFKAREYYQKSANLSDYSGAKDALNKFSS